MIECNQTECDVVVELKKLNFKLTILTYMIAVLLFIVAWSAYTVLSCYDFEYESTTVTIDSSDGTGDAIYQTGEGNVINGESDSQENKDQPQE